jgi:hypothetical protein
LLTGKAYELATHVLGASPMTERSYEEVFTVTRAEIERYITAHSIPMDRVSTNRDSRESIHFIRTDSGWELYWYERGCVLGHKTFADESHAQHALVDLLLASSGTGIKFV